MVLKRNDKQKGAEHFKATCTKVPHFHLIQKFN